MERGLYYCDMILYQILVVEALYIPFLKSGVKFGPVSKTPMP